MREYTKKTENQPRTLDSNPKESRQAPISEILQASDNGTLGKQTQRESKEDEELLQTKRWGEAAVEVTLQRYKENVRRNAPEEDEDVLQGKADTLQLETIDEDESLQGKFNSTSTTEQYPVQREEKPHNTGLPDNLKTVIEDLSGYNTGEAKGHSNSDRPARSPTLAYTHATHMQTVPGQEKYLSHKLGQVIQQMKGPVSSPVSLTDIPVKDDSRFEKEADNDTHVIQRRRKEAVSDCQIGKDAFGNVIQMLKINNLIQGDSNVTSRVYAAVVTKQNNNKNKNYDYKVRSYKHVFDEASEDNVRDKIAEVGALASADKFTNNTKRIIITPKQNKTWKDVNRDDLEGALHPSVDFYAPFILRLENINKHNKDGVLEDLAKPLNFDILFASGFYGYVVKVGDSHMEADTTNSNSLLYIDAPAGTLYDFKHEQNEDNHAEKIGNYAKSWGNENEEEANERHLSADSITKVIGEGSRWQAVATLANRGNLKDSSVFYVDNADKENTPMQIKFSGLWKTWANPFKNRFGILDDELKTKLQDGAGKIKDFKVSGDECKKIGELEKDKANYKL